MKKEVKNKLNRRLKIIEGQARGLQKMIKEERYCLDVITQSSALREALSAMENEILKDHLSSCVVGQIKSGKSRKVTAEILNIYKLAKKNN